jgi:hypothetical protein
MGKTALVGFPQAWAWIIHKDKTKSRPLGQTIDDTKTEGMELLAAALGQAGVDKTFSPEHVAYGGSHFIDRELFFGALQFRCGSVCARQLHR